MTDEKGDGRIFGWKKASMIKDDVRNPTPVIIIQKGVGGDTPLLVSRVLLPTEYDDSLETLAARYPYTGENDGPRK